MNKKNKASGKINGNNKPGQEIDKLQAAETTETPEEEKELEECKGEEAHTVEVELAEEPAVSAEEIAKIIKEKDEYYDRLLRTQADFDNYKKRVQKEQPSLIRYGAENALREILPVLDNLERALESARKHGESNFHLREGIELILSQFSDVMGKLGVKPIETVGHPFDPNKHDALLRVHKPDLPEGVVVEEIRRGYYLHDKVLRPAQVTVGSHEQA